MAVTRRGEGVGSPSQELKHFTDREEPRQRFWELVDRDSKSGSPVLMFYGVGGIGKSFLLKKLHQDARDREIPCALIDFDAKSPGARFRNDSAELLAEIWRKLDVECPRFELAYTMMKFKQGAGDKPLLRHSGKASNTFELFKELGGSVLPGAGFVIDKLKAGGNALLSRYKETPVGQWILSKSGNQDFLLLERMSPEEIYPTLAERLGQDLDQSLPARPGKINRAVVFLDTFEELHLGLASDAQQYAIESRARELYQNLTCVLLVIAGRDLLIWDQFDRGWADRNSLEQHLLGGLSRHDASAFLAKCGIEAGPLQEKLLRVSRDQKNLDEEAYYPYSLGLCADAVVAERHGGREPDPATFDMAPNDYDKLAERFLKSLHDDATTLTIIHLAQPPRFDEAAARHAISPQPGRHQDAAWENLLDYSFVQESTDPGWYRLHSHMSASLRNKLADDKEKFTQTHAEWQAYWKSRVESEVDDHATLAWFHDWILKPKEALQYWADLTQRVRKSGKMSVHHDLLDWWIPTAVEGAIPKDETTAAALLELGRGLNEATLGNRSSNQRRAIACYELALRYSTETSDPANWAATQNNLGNAYRELPTGDRGANLRKAISCFESALRVYMELDYPVKWAMTQNNLGISYGSLPTGDREANLRKAISCLELALRVYTELDYPAEWAMTQNNLGNIYHSLPTGDREANLRAAIACYESALRFYTESDYPAAWAMTQNNLGATYFSLRTGNREANRRAGIACFESVLRVYTESEYPADWAMTQNNLGNAYRNLPTGGRAANLRTAIACYESALRVYTESDYPAQWARTKQSLANARAELDGLDRPKD